MAIPWDMYGARAWPQAIPHELRQDALDCARDIGDALVAKYAADGPLSYGRPARYYSLSQGTAGVALFLRYLEAHVPDCGYAGVSDELLGAAVSSTAIKPMPPSLFGGFVGIGWTVAHLERIGATKDTIDLTDVDSVVSRLVARTPWERDIDLTNGLVGLGVYMLERRPTDLRSATLEQIVERLTELAVESEDGITWFHRPDLLAPSTRVRFPTGWYNLGVAHGVPGIIGLLARIYAAGVASTAAKALLEGAVKWLLRQQLPSSADGYFPAIIVEQPPAGRARCAWCYGDPAIAAVLLHAGVVTRDPGWCRTAIAIARSAAARTGRDAGVIDACICHGAAGLLLLFARLGMASGVPECMTAAAHWGRRTLMYRESGCGVAGFRYLERVAGSQRIYVDADGFLTGAAGIGLALLGALNSGDLSWDRLLLSDIPCVQRDDRCAANDGRSGDTTGQSNNYGENMRRESR